MAASKAKNHSILIENLPPNLRNWRALSEFFKSVLIDDVVKIHIILRSAKLEALVDQRVKIRKLLRRCDGNDSERLTWISRKWWIVCSEYCHSTGRRMPMERLAGPYQNTFVFESLFQFLSCVQVERQPFFEIVNDLLSDRIRDLQKCCILNCEYCSDSEYSHVSTTDGTNANADNSHSVYLFQRFGSYLVDTLPWPNTEGFSEDPVDISSTAFVTFRTTRSACIAQHTLLSEVTIVFFRTTLYAIMNPFLEFIEVQSISGSCPRPE